VGVDGRTSVPCPEKWGSLGKTGQARCRLPLTQSRSLRIFSQPGGHNPPSLPMIPPVALRLDCKLLRGAALAILFTGWVAYGQDAGPLVPPESAEEIAGTATETSEPSTAPESVELGLLPADVPSPAPIEPGSFFRSSPPPDVSGVTDADSAEGGGVAAPAAEADGMSRFGGDPPFSPPQAVASGASGNASIAGSDPLGSGGVPPAGSFGVPVAAGALGSQPPLPSSPAVSVASEAGSPAGFSAPPAADGTRSVLTSAPETADSSAVGVIGPPAGSLPPSDPYLRGTAANPQPPAALAVSGGVRIASTGSGSPGDAAGSPSDSAAPADHPPQPALPIGPATSLIDAAIEAVEPGMRPAVLAGLAERPLPLLEALERSGDRGRRLWITQAYWKLVEQTAVLRWTAEAAERLDLVAPSGDPHDRATLDVAVASRLADVAAARAALVSAQQELVDLVRLPATEALPWPVDRPLATSYETHFDVLFASRIATGRIRAIHRSLPLEHQEVDARAAAVLAAETAVEMAENDHARGVRGIESVIAAHAALLEQQKALAKAVTRYNDDIVEYVMAVADFSVPDDQFGTMLIGAPTPWRPAVALTSATVPNGGVPTLAPPPAGFGSQPAAAAGFPGP
jgi:hypothetical protein